MGPDKLTAWFDAHAAALLLYARQRLGGAVSAEQAQDVVQEAFVRLMTQCSAGREPGDVAAWLFTTVRHAAIDLARSETRRRRRERRSVGSGSDPCSGADRHLFDSQRGSAIDAEEAEWALSRLPADLREIVTLRIWGGMTLVQVARVTGLAVSTVHDRYRAALKELRAFLCQKTSTTRVKS